MLLRYFLCACLSLCFAASLRAQTDFGGGGGQPFNPDENMLQRANDELKANPQKIPGANANQLKHLIDQNRQLGTTATAALCQICKQPLYRHGEPGFKCRPVNVDGEFIHIAEIEWKNVQCPICRSNFSAPMRGNLNEKNGTDKDFCQHSVGKVCVHSSVWTCPNCGYSALIDSFGETWDRKPVDEKLAAFVLSDVKPTMFSRMCRLAGIKEASIAKNDTHGFKNFAAWFQGGDGDEAHTDQLPDWIKYDNAIKIYKHEDAPHALLLQLYLQGAYSCRRELNNEIAVPVLLAALEERLSLSIRKIQHDLTAATIQIRHERKQDRMIDPNKAETDPQILCDAAELLLEMGDVNADRVQLNPRLAAVVGKDQLYSLGDLYVLCMRYAGFLDRLGRYQDASRALNKAQNFFVPERMPDVERVAPEAVKFAENQLRLLRDFAEDRRKCLDLEQEWINRAMWENLLAVHKHQMRFVDPNNLLAEPAKDQFDPAMVAYIIGELGRRCSEPGAAPAFLAAASAILERQVAEVEREVKAVALKNDAPAVQAAAIERSKKLSAQWDLVRPWIDEQRKLARSDGKIDEQVKVVLDEMLQAAGIDPATFKASSVPIGPSAAIGTRDTIAPRAKPALDAAPVAQPIVNSGDIKTRDDLYKMYYEAISRYVKDKKSNPPCLAALVQAGYITEANSCLPSLSDKAQPVCPETGDQLMYARTFNFGAAAEPILFQVRDAAKSKILYANGQIRIPVKH